MFFICRAVVSGAVLVGRCTVIKQLLVLFLLTGVSAASAADVVSLKCEDSIFRLNYENENAEWVLPSGRNYMIPIQVGATQIVVKNSAAIRAAADGVIDRTTLKISYSAAGLEYQCEIVDTPKPKI